MVLTKTTKLPLVEHLNELRRRLLWLCGVLFIGITAGFIFSENIIKILVKPINQKLIYTSPTGGFEFIVKVAVFLAFLIAIPAAIYHLIKFVQPVIGRQSVRSIAGYLITSFLLLVAGVAFAYFVSLPSALHFLLNFGNENIEPLLSTNEYVNFVMVYLIGFGLLFQIPLLLMFINRIKPLKPSKLMKGQKFVIVGSFIASAIITPTPDPLNQLIMAVPMILMYQAGVTLVWLKNRKMGKQKAEPSVLAADPTPRLPDIQKTPHSHPLTKVMPPAVLDLSVQLAPKVAASPVVQLQPSTKVPQPSSGFDIVRPSAA